MRKEEFREWLLKDIGKDIHQATDILSRVARVEREFSKLNNRNIDIETECDKGQCDIIVKKLCLSERKLMPKEINLPNNTAGISQLRTAVNFYNEFYAKRNDKMV